MPKQTDTTRTRDDQAQSCWHSYGLQSLNTSRFIEITGAILDGRIVLITTRGNRKIRGSLIPPAGSEEKSTAMRSFC